MKAWAEHALGIGICVTAAGVLSFAFRSSPLKSLLPLVFFAVVIFVAAKFGSVSGILGTVAAAIIFAEFLFQPTLSLRVNDSTQRDNLMWMIIIGIAASGLLGVPKTPGDGGNPGGTPAI